MRDAVFVCSIAGSLPGQRGAMEQPNAHGFVYMDTPADADADFAAESFFGGASYPIDGCAADRLDIGLGAWAGAGLLGRRAAFLGHWHCLSALFTWERTADKRGDGHRFVRNSEEICQEAYKKICYDRNNREERQNLIGYDKTKEAETYPREK